LNNGALTGVAIVVTRAVPQAESLLAALETIGGSPVALPLLEILDAIDGGEALRERVTTASAADWLVVLSPNGANRLPPGPFPGKVAAIASGTAAALTEAGYVVDLLPEVASSVGLLEAFAGTEFPGRVIIAQAENGRPELGDGLRGRGVEVDVVTAYRNVMPPVSAAEVEQANAADLVVFASPSAVKRYVEHVGTSPRRAVCIGAVTAASASAADFDVEVSAAPTTADIVDAIARVIESRSDT